jgi:hypothetical protein
MRKLTTLATAAIAAAVLFAVAAAPANADRPFEVTDPYGNPCSPYCLDTGYSGTFKIGGTPCTASFDLRIEADGSFVTYNTNASCIQGFSLQVAWECDDSWTGEERVPDTGAIKVDLDACLTYYPHFTNWDHDITFHVISNNPRRWAQVGDSVTSAYLPISSALLTDSYSNDNVKLRFL